ncbi:MAG TPA: GAF domain-containing sensor histidine kinase, partial [Phototrophicaceae bacterium]|nr:GAF domain-containing sensor histidine kinase [Phototrophicaceae bacterium]
LAQEILISSFNVRQISSFARIIGSRQPLIIPDLTRLSGWMKSLGPHKLRSYIGAPILLGEQIIGLINLESYNPGFFTETHARRLQLFAGQAAVAIQNAFAYERAQEQAATEERQRLARDLHDAVSQTLFSASVMAEALPRLFDHQPQEVRVGLGKLARLTRGALAEMRTLLVELRPSALIETDLSILLKQLITGFQSRSDLEITLEITGQEWRLPQDVHISLYRVAQEAMNNVIKHARASHASVYVIFRPDEIWLRVLDDGRGFDVNQISPERMGLRIMSERAAANDIMLTVTGEPDQGTLVEAKWRKQRSDA